MNGAAGQDPITRHFGGWSAKLFADSAVVPPGRRLLYLAGMGAEDVDDGHIHFPGDIVGQARYSFQKIKRILSMHGGTMADIVKITTYVTDVQLRDDYTKCRLEAFGDEPLSPHTFVVVAGLAWPDMLVEVDVTAVIS